MDEGGKGNDEKNINKAPQDDESKDLIGTNPEVHQKNDVSESESTRTTPEQINLVANLATTEIQKNALDALDALDAQGNHLDELEKKQLNEKKQEIKTTYHQAIVKIDIILREINSDTKENSTHQKITTTSEKNTSKTPIKNTQEDSMINDQESSKSEEKKTTKTETQPIKNKTETTKKETNNDKRIKINKLITNYREILKKLPPSSANTESLGSLIDLITNRLEKDKRLSGEVLDIFIRFLEKYKIDETKNITEPNQVVENYDALPEIKKTTNEESPETTAEVVIESDAVNTDKDDTDKIAEIKEGTTEATDTDTKINKISNLINTLSPLQLNEEDKNIFNLIETDHKKGFANEKMINDAISALETIETEYNQKVTPEEDASAEDVQENGAPIGDQEVTSGEDAGAVKGKDDEEKDSDHKTITSKISRGIIRFKNFYDKWFLQRKNIKSEKIEAKIERKETQKKSLEKEIKRLENTINNKNSNLKEKSKAQYKKNTIVKKIHELDKEKGGYIEDLERVDNEKQKYHQRISERCLKVSEAFKEKITPYQKDISEARTKLNEINQEIIDGKNNKKEWEDKLLDFQNKLFFIAPKDEESLKGALNEVEDRVKKIDRLITNSSKNAKTLKKKISHLENKIKPWKKLQKDYDAISKLPKPKRNEKIENFKKENITTSEQRFEIPPNDTVVDLNNYLKSFNSWLINNHPLQSPLIDSRLREELKTDGSQTTLINIEKSISQIYKNKINENKLKDIFKFTRIEINKVE